MKAKCPFCKKEVILGKMDEILLCSCGALYAICDGLSASLEKISAEIGQRLGLNIKTEGRTIRRKGKKVLLTFFKKK